jgi:hypothetical protein
MLPRLLRGLLRKQTNQIFPKPSKAVGEAVQVILVIVPAEQMLYEWNDVRFQRSSL